MTYPKEIASESENTFPVKSDAFLLCFICEGEISDGVEFFSCSISEEFYDDGAYTVTNSDGLAQICTSCVNKYAIISKIESEVHSSTGVGYRQPTDNENIVPLDHMYDCFRCSKPIRDGENIIVVTNAFHTCSGYRCTVSHAWIVSVMCKPCVGLNDIRNELAVAIDNQVAIARRKLVTIAK